MQTSGKPGLQGLIQDWSVQIQDPASGLPRMNRFPRTAMNMAASVFPLGGMYQEQSTRGMPPYIQAPLQGSGKE
jgi:hypothetical protein